MSGPAPETGRPEVGRPEVRATDSRPPVTVWILMGLYRGEAHLEAQLDSLAAQRHPHWRLVVSDDSPAGTEAPGRAILARFGAAHPGRLAAVRPGPREGVTANVLSLLADLPGLRDRDRDERGGDADGGADVYADGDADGTGGPEREQVVVALCDQDDVWHPDKLERAVAALRHAGRSDVPVLYCAARRVCDAALVPRAGQERALRRPPDFRNALVQSVAGGHTMVLNAAAATLAGAAARTEARGTVIHDWWLYQIVSGAGGQVIHDAVPVLDYRQHDGNLIGADPSALRRMARVGALLGGRYGDWNARNVAALRASAHRLTPEARRRLEAFAAAGRTSMAGARGPGRVARRLMALRRSGAVRQGRAGTLALWLACLLGRL